MDNSPIKKPVLTIILVIVPIFLFTGYIINLLDTTTKVIFCNVGQGDATYIRVRNKIDIVVDAGPDRSILNCLGKYMPFYDRKIEIAILSHPQKDHYGGFNYLIKRYKIETFMTLKTEKTTKSYQDLKKQLIDKQVSFYYPNEKSKILVLDAMLEFFWPIADIKSKNIFSYKQSVNNSSLFFLYKDKIYKILFTGDIDADVLDVIANQAKGNIKRPSWINSTILKIPHHGSKNGLSLNFLKLANPQRSVISVGKDNTYGHPSSLVLNMLEALHKKYLRTDLEGDIIFKLAH